MRNLAVVTQDGLESFELARSLLRLNIQTQTRRHTKTHRDTHMRWLARCCAYSHRRPRDSVTKSTDKSTQKKGKQTEKSLKKGGGGGERERDKGTESTEEYHT